MVKEPSALVVTPLFVPFTCTVAPGTDELLSPSVTLPETFFCEKAVAEQIRKKSIRKLFLIGIE